MEFSTPTATSLHIPPTADEFFRLKITVDGEPYTKTRFDEVHENLISERLSRTDDRDDVVLVAPETPLVLPILLAIGMIKLLKLDLVSDPNNPSNQLAVDSPVGLLEQDKLVPGIYLGMEENPSLGMMHKVKRNDGVTHYIKISERWRIQSLSVLDNFEKSKSRAIHGQAIEELLGIPRGSILALLKSKALIVTANKEKIISDLKSVAIGGDSFEQIFTVARTDGFDFSFVGRNDLKVSPRILFSSSLSNAADMVKDDPDIRLIIVAGYKAKDYSNLDYINNDSVPRKIVCLVAPDQDETVHDLTEKNFDALIWKRSDFQSEQVSTKTTSERLNEHNLMIRELAGSQFLKAEVDWPNGMKDVAERSIQTIKKLEKLYGHSIDLTHWLWTAYSLVNRIIQVPFGINGFESWLNANNRQSEGIKGNFAMLAVRYNELAEAINKEASELVNSLLRDISDLVTIAADDSNPKQKFVEVFESQHPECTVQLMTGVTVFDEYLGHLAYIRAKTNFRPKKYINHVLILASKKKKSAFAEGFLAPFNKVIYLGYDTEMKYFQWYFNTAITGPNSDSDGKIREILNMKRVHDSTFPKALPVTKQEGDEIEEEIKSDEILQDKLQNLLGDVFEKPQKIPTSLDDKIVEANRIVLSNGLMIYLSPNHRVAKLNEEGTGYEMVTFSKLSPKDKLIFVSGNRDLFKEVIDVIRSADSYRLLYEKSDVWRIALNEFAQKNSCSAADISKRLRSLGCSRSAQLVKQWMAGDTICPQDDALQAIRLMTLDDRLLNGVREVAAAGKQIQSIHHKTGMELVRRILNRAIGEEQYGVLGMGNEIDYHISMCASKARILGVHSISQFPSHVSVKLEGRLQPDEADPDRPLRTESSAEKQLFQKLRTSNLPDTWYGFHSLSLSKHRNKREGEIDFLIVNRKALIVLEVKGGRIARQGGEWLFTNRHGETTVKHESPFEQAKTAMYSLSDSIKRALGFDFSQMVMGYGTAFPDIEFSIQSPEWDSDMVYSALDEGDLDGFLLKLQSNWELKQKRSQELSKEQFAKLITFLRGEFDLVKPLSNDIREIEAEFIKLTEEQSTCLTQLEDNARVWITGSAGTGKTMLALEQARKNQRQKIKTLFLCYNKFLSGHLRYIFQQEFAGEDLTVEFNTVHGFMISTIEQVSGSSVLAGVTKDDEFYNKTLPELFVRAIPDAKKVEYLILDEAQDVMCPTYIDPIGLALDGGWADGKWSVFLDPENQKNMFAKIDSGTVAALKNYAAKFRLDKNCRNTRSIAKQAELISTLDCHSNTAVEGLKVQFIWYDNDFEQSVKVSEAINKTLSTGVAPNEIIVLSGLRNSSSLAGSGRLRVDAKLSEFRIEEDPRSDTIAYATIQSYKGLESPVVAMTDISQAGKEYNDLINYVGMTRARSFLILSLHKSLRKYYNEKVRELL